MKYADTNLLLIDTSNEKYNEEFYSILESQKKNANIDGFAVDNFCLVRTTNDFPYNKELHILDDSNSPMKFDSFISSTLSMILTRQKYGKTYGDYYRDGTLSENNEEAEKSRLIESDIKEELCTIIGFGYRTTKHFTLNGLVASHQYGGDFNNRKIIILDPLNEHISDPRMMSLGESDTYFKLEKDKPLVLSDKATLLIGAKQYEEIVKDDEMKKQLEQFNVVLYKGDEKIATDMCLSKLGFLSEDIGTWGYEMQCCMDNAVARLQETHHIPYIQDFSSDHNYEDKVILERQLNESLRSFNLFFIEKFKDKINLTLEELEKLYNDGTPDIEKREGRITEIIETIGIDEILLCINEFNNKQLEEMKTRSNQKNIADLRVK
jgi:hypothetical protein